MKFHENSHFAILPSPTNLTLFRKHFMELNANPNPSRIPRHNIPSPQLACAPCVADLLGILWPYMGRIGEEGATWGIPIAGN